MLARRAVLPKSRSAPLPTLRKPNNSFELIFLATCEALSLIESYSCAKTCRGALPITARSAPPTEHRDANDLPFLFNNLHTLLSFFAPRANHNSFLFIRFRTLLQKHPGASPLTSTLREVPVHRSRHSSSILSAPVASPKSLAPTPFAPSLSESTFKPSTKNSCPKRASRARDLCALNP
jgi:hypothetical protein